MSSFLFGLLATLGYLAALVLAPVLLVTLAIVLLWLGFMVARVLRRIKVLLDR